MTGFERGEWLRSVSGRFPLWTPDGTHAAFWSRFVVNDM